MLCLLRTSIYVQMCTFISRDDAFSQCQTARHLFRPTSPFSLHLQQIWSYPKRVVAHLTFAVLPSPKKESRKCFYFIKFHKAPEKGTDSLITDLILQKKDLTWAQSKRTPAAETNNREVPFIHQHDLLLYFIQVPHKYALILMQIVI